MLPTQSYHILLVWLVYIKWHLSEARESWSTETCQLCWFWSFAEVAWVWVSKDGVDVGWNFMMRTLSETWWCGHWVKLGGVDVGWNLMVRTLGETRWCENFTFYILKFLNKYFKNHIYLHLSLYWYLKAKIHIILVCVCWCGTRPFTYPLSVSIGIAAFARVGTECLSVAIILEKRHSANILHWPNTPPPFT